jgi:hypothetical protein
MAADEGRIRTHRPNNHLNLVVWSEIVRIGRRRTRWWFARTRTTQQATAETFSTCCGYILAYSSSNIQLRISSDGSGLLYSFRVGLFGFFSKVADGCREIRPLPFVHHCDDE